MPGHKRIDPDCGCSGCTLLRTVLLPNKSTATPYLLGGILTSVGETMKNLLKWPFGLLIVAYLAVTIVHLSNGIGFGRSLAGGGLSMHGLPSLARAILGYFGTLSTGMRSRILGSEQSLRLAEATQTFANLALTLRSVLEYSMLNGRHPVRNPPQAFPPDPSSFVSVPPVLVRPAGFESHRAMANDMGISLRCHGYPPFYVTNCACSKNSQES